MSAFFNFKWFLELLPHIPHTPEELAQFLLGLFTGISIPPIILSTQFIGLGAGINIVLGLPTPTPTGTPTPTRIHIQTATSTSTLTPTATATPTPTSMVTGMPIAG